MFVFATAEASEHVGSYVCMYVDINVFTRPCFIHRPHLTRTHPAHLALNSLLIALEEIKQVREQLLVAPLLIVIAWKAFVQSIL